MGVIGSSASADVDAPPERCYAEAADIERISEWQSGVEQVNILTRDASGRPQVAELVTDAKVRTLTSKVEFSYDEPREISWRQQSGDLKSIEGSWTFEGLDGGRTRATYALEVDPGRMLGMLVRGPVEGQLKDKLIHARPEELRKRVG